MQPVKKKIQEVHSDKIKEAPFKTLLVDGNSLLFTSFKDDKVNSDGVHYGGVFQFLLQLRMLLTKGEFEYVYVFFDNEYSGWQRWRLYPYYKQNRDKHYEDYDGQEKSEYYKEYEARLKAMQNYFANKKLKQKRKKEVEEDVDDMEKQQSKSSKYKEFLDANFDRERDILCKCFEELSIRWNIDNITEGDDQIAYYCLHKKPNEKIIIVSADMDLSQLLAEDIAIYNQSHDLKVFIRPENFAKYFGYYYENTLVKKIFTGDASDNISNIKGLSEEGFFKLMPEARTRKVTVADVKARAQELIDERIKDKKKPLLLHENIINGVSNKDYGGDFYEINEKIIDLRHPLLSESAKETMDGMMHAPLDPEGRSFKNLYRIMLDEKIEELMGDTRFASFFAPFKTLEEKERRRYEKSQKEK